MGIAVIIWVLFAHWAADFLCQTRWMGDNKSSNINAMAAHIGVYAFVLGLFMQPVFLQQYSTSCTFVGINAALHLATDYVTSNITKYAYRKQKMHLFWSTIGFDQFLHVSALLLTLGVF